MHRRQHETTRNTTDLSQAPQPETLEAKTIQHPPYDLLAQPPLGASNASNPLAQAKALNRASGGQLSRAGDSLLQLQRQHGNRYVQQVVKQARHSQASNPATSPVIQTKLVVGPVDDKHEREADRVAKRVASQTFSPGEMAQTGKNKEGQAGRLMRKPDIQPGHNNAGAGAVDAGVQQAIQQARGTGQPLPSNLRTSMEQALGADFGRVRTHADTRSDRLNQSLQAKAFTSGQDIFFRQGAYQLGSRTGRELLAHELTHVVQQCGQTGGEAKSGSAIQRKPEIIGKDSNTFRDSDRPEFGDLIFKKTSKTRRYVAFYSKGKAKVVIYDRLVYDYVDDDELQAATQDRQDPPAEIPGQARKIWHKPRARETRELNSPESTQNQPEPSSQQTTSSLLQKGRRRANANPVLPQSPGSKVRNKQWVGGGFKTGAEVLVATSDTLTTNLVKNKLDSSSIADPTQADRAEQQMANLGASGAVLDAFGGIAILVKSIEKLFREKGGWDRAKAGMDVVEGVLKTGSAVSGSIDYFAKIWQGGEISTGLGPMVGPASKAASTVAAKSLSSIGDCFSAIKTAVKRVKEFVDLAKGAMMTGTTKEEAWDTIMGSIKDAAEMAQSAASAAKNIMTVAESSGASEAAKQAVPGLGIAVNAVDAIMRAGHFVLAARGQAQIRTEKRKIKTTNLEWFIGSERKNKTHGREKHVKKRKGEIETELTGQPSHAKEVQLSAELGDIEEYLAAKELQSINEKRMKRDGTKIALALTKIAGDVAYLVPPATIAGLGIKAGASGLEVVFSATRRVKQLGHDVAYKKSEKRKLAVSGKKSKIEKIFNPNKSTKEKAKMRQQLINQLFRMMANATAAADLVQLERVEEYFNAAGLNWDTVKLYKDANDLAAALDEALQKRE